MAADEGLAEQLPESGRRRPPMATWSQEAELLASVVDRLGTVIRGLQGLGRGKPTNFKPYPRPPTAFERVNRRRAQMRHEGLVARVLKR